MRMHSLPVREDPTGFLNLFRLAAMDRFGDPSGYIQGRGRWHHGRKKGPGRRHDTSELPKAAKTLSELRKDAFTRNPFEVLELPRQFEDTPRRRVVLGPVRMKLPRLRRCSR